VDHTVRRADLRGFRRGSTTRTLAPNGEPALVDWWQGQGAVLNVTKKEALVWMEYRMRALMASTGVSGFKFDAGEASFVPAKTMEDANSFATAWALFAGRFGGSSEVRCARSTQGIGIWTREFDKDSRWGLHNGLTSLVTSALHLGISGYAFVLPDMVGGNAYSDSMLGGAEDVTDSTVGSVNGTFGDSGSTRQIEKPLSSQFYGVLPPRELYVRWCVANAFLPAMQFSIAPWQYDEAASVACRRALSLRDTMLPLLESLAARALSHGDPIVRPMWWFDPTDPTCHWIADQFLLGNQTLVAPVLEPGTTSRAVYLPRGQWVDKEKRVHVGPTWIVEHQVALDEVGIFEWLSGI